jgi:hypothetical protein
MDCRVRKYLFAEELYFLAHLLCDVVLTPRLMYQFCRPLDGKRDVADLVFDVAEKVARP